MKEIILYGLEFQKCKSLWWRVRTKFTTCFTWNCDTTLVACNRLEDKTLIYCFAVQPLIYKDNDKHTKYKWGNGINYMGDYYAMHWLMRFMCRLFREGVPLKVLVDVMLEAPDNYINFDVDEEVLEQTLHDRVKDYEEQYAKALKEIDSFPIIEKYNNEVIDDNKKILVIKERFAL